MAEFFTGELTGLMHLHTTLLFRCLKPFLRLPVAKHALQELRLSAACSVLVVAISA